MIATTKNQLPKQTRQPLVTIVVPVYNGEAYLARALDSILAQTYKNVEILILDNCSSDSTPHIIDRYAKKDPRIRVVRHMKNIGSLPNWDYGVRHAKGSYIAIYHADDEYLPTILEEQMRIFAVHKEVSCVFTNSITIDGKGRQIGLPVLPEHLINKPLKFTELFEYILRTFRSPFLAPSCIATRSSYKKAGKYAGQFTQAGDVGMYLRLTKTGSAYLLDKRLMRYRHTDSQASIRYSTTYTKPNQLFGVLEQQLRDVNRENKQKENVIPKKTLTMFYAYKDWDYTVCAINILAKKNVTKEEKRIARHYLYKSCTMRRILRVHKELLLMMITCAMLVCVHVGLGRWFARTINEHRQKRHLTS